MQPVPRDGETVASNVPGNIVMKLSQERKGTKEAFAGGWFPYRRYRVLDEHGYIIIKDRSKDIIISV